MADDDDDDDEVEDDDDDDDSGDSDGDNNLASNDLATWIGDGELPGGRHLVKYLKDGDEDNEDNDDTNLVKYDDNQ